MVCLTQGHIRINNMNYDYNTRMAPYTEGINLFVEWCSKIPSATPIEFGSVGCPGLSDIDIGIVFEEGFDHGDLNLHLKSFPKKTRELMNGGTLMFFPESILKNILLIDDINIKFLTNKIDIRRITNEEKNLIDLVQIMEWLPERMANTYLEFKKSNPNNKRLVGLFYSSCYSLEKIQSIVGYNEQVDRFIKSVSTLRKEWFSMEKSKMHDLLNNVSLTYFKVCDSAINMIISTLSNHFKIAGLGVRYNICRNINFIGVHEGIGFYEGEDKLFLKVPEIFLCTYLKYSQYSSCLGSIIAKRIKVNNFDVMVSDDMNNILDKRIEILSSLFEFVRKLNCGSGLYKFGWYLNE